MLVTQAVSNEWLPNFTSSCLLQNSQQKNVYLFGLIIVSIRLGFGENQLLEDFSGTLPERNNESNIVSRAGIPLPSGFRIHSMSMMRDPSESTPTTCQLTSSNRAILLLTYVSCQEGGNSYVKYAAYQLQTNMQPAKNTDKVLVRLALHGIIPLKLGSSPDLYAVESVAGIFLAGGSFLFDFFAETELHGMTLYSHCVFLNIFPLLNYLLIFRLPPTTSFSLFVHFGKTIMMP